MLKLTGISKSFPGVKALQDVNLTILPGEIHALCGENGAGKSTLMNILAGNLQPDQGEIQLNDVVVHFHNPKDAFSNGVSIVYQHLSLVDNLSIAENIFANQQPTSQWGLIRFRELYENTSALLQELMIDYLKPQTQVAYLSPAQKQMIEIAKALSKKPSILILDEPTASLTDRETSTLYGILQKLKAQRVAVIYISHRLEEIYLLADKISVLKDGQSQGTYLKQDLTKEALVNRMVGRDVQTLRTQSSATKDVLFTVEGLTGNRFSDISFKIHKGEIVGFSGLVGAGRTEIARAIIGADEKVKGTINLGGAFCAFQHPGEAISKGIAYSPEERNQLGLFPSMSVKENIISAKLKNVLTKGLYDDSKAKQLALTLKEKLRIVTPGIEQKVINLSGGNQQKVVFAKWLLADPALLILDEPTHGIDVGAKFEIYELIQALAFQGKGIIIISSDLPELLGLCDRIIVIRKGGIVGTFTAEEATEQKIMAMASN